nr:unnamed protein product [Digitaria exilis]
MFNARPGRRHRHKAALGPQRAGAPGHHCGGAAGRPTGARGGGAELIREQVARVDDAYFRSFIDFASSVGVVEEEGLVPPLADPEAAALGAHMAMYCSLRVPFYDMDFGGGRQFLYTPGGGRWRCSTSTWESAQPISSGS